MKLKKSTYALLALSVGIAACNTDYEDFADQTPQQPPVAASFNKAFSASTENTGSLSKAYQGGTYTELHTGDVMSVFSGSTNNKFVNTTNNIFEGNADNADIYYALFPYKEGATINGNVISVNIPAVQTTDTANVNGQYNQYNNYVLSVGVTTEQEKAFALKNASAEIMFYVYGDNPLEKVEITASQNIVGDVKIAIGDDGIPTMTGGESKTVTINNPLTNNNYNFVSVVPAGIVDLEVKFYRDGKLAGTRYYSDVNLARNSMARLGTINWHKVNFDTQVDGATIESIAEAEGWSINLPYIGATNGTLTFAGWKAPDGTIYGQGGKFTIGHEDVTLTAEWVEGLVLTYYNTEIAPVVFQPGDKITLAAAPEIPGYIFLAWYVNDEEKQPGDTITLESSTTVWPMTKDAKYTITLLADGGKFDNGSDTLKFEMTVNDYMYIETWNNPPTISKNTWNDNREDVGTGPTKDGYVLENFIEGTEITYGIWYPTSERTLTAKWAKKYTLDYYTENGDTLNVGNNYYTENYTSFYVSCPYRVDGKILTGWKDQDGNIYKNGQQVSVSILEELKDLKFTPILESDENASSHEGWTSQPF